MATRNAEDIFETFKSFRTYHGPDSPDERLKQYCQDVLSSVEDLHFDYKRKRNAREPGLDDDDKKNLAKALSGFANSGGGVLLWGIEENKDKGSLNFQPIREIQTFTKNVMELSGQATDPPIPAVAGDWLPAKSDPDAGFAALLIPESPLPPHRVILKISEVQHRYFIRSGSVFPVASHTQLENMFGRRPQPKLVVQVPDRKFTANSQNWLLAFDLVNEGRGTAKLVCVEFESQDGLDCSDDGNWCLIRGTYNVLSGHRSLLLELRGTPVLHPGMRIRCNALITKRERFPSGQSVRFPCTLYCEGAMPVQTFIEGTLKERKR
jgi:hypothetical protein